AIRRAVDHSDPDGTSRSPRSPKDTRKLSQDASAVPNSGYRLQTFHGFFASASLHRRFQGVPEVTGKFGVRRALHKKCSRALIERPYSREPQAVGAVYDRPGFFVQSPTGEFPISPKMKNSLV